MREAFIAQGLREALRTLRVRQDDAAAWQAVEAGDHDLAAPHELLDICEFALTQGRSVTRPYVSFFKRSLKEFSTSQLVHITVLSMRFKTYFEAVSARLEEAIARRGVPDAASAYPRMLAVCLRRLQSTALPSVVEAIARNGLPPRVQQDAVVQLGARAVQHKGLSRAMKEATLNALIHAALDAYRHAESAHAPVQLALLALDAGSHHLARPVVQHVPQANVRWHQVSCLLARTFQRHPPLAAELMRNIVRYVQRHGVPLSSIVEVLETINHNRGSTSLFRMLEDTVAQQVADLSPVCASRLVVAYVRARCHSPGLLERLAPRLRLGEVAPPLASGVVFSWAVARAAAGELFADADATFAGCEALDPQAMTDLVWSGASLAVPLPRVARRLSEGPLGGYDSRQLVCIAWSLKKMRCAHNARRLEAELFRHPVDGWREIDVSTARHAVEGLSPKLRGVLEKELRRRVKEKGTGKGKGKDKGS